MRLLPCRVVTAGFFSVPLVLIAVFIAWSGCAISAGLTTSCHLKYKATVIPLLFSYSFVLPFGADDKFSVRATPTVGFLHWRSKITDYSSSAYVDEATPSYSGNDTALSYGLGLGFTWHINQRLFVDIAYRWLGTDDIKVMSYSEEDEHGRDATTIILKKQNTHSLTAAIGFKF
jgi:opacity protein-like surface antigen